MPRSTARPSSDVAASTDLQAWLIGEPELDPDGMTLLAAYRDAAEAARKSASASVRPSSPSAASSGNPEQVARQNLHENSETSLALTLENERSSSLVVDPSTEVANAHGANTEAANPEATASRQMPLICRFPTVAEIDSERLAALHGRLIAAGYLMPELLGRTDGLAYRLTRDGIRRLNGEADAA